MGLEYPNYDDDAAGMPQDPAPADAGQESGTSRPEEDQNDRLTSVYRVGVPWTSY
ncbi:hypothetical protein KEM56_003298, partial [Ascosphaera pollenicola]